MTSKPASRARTAICSAPLQCPSRPGLPTRNRSRPPSSSPVAATRVAHRRELRAASGDPDRAGHPGRSAVLAEHLAQRSGPLPRGHAGAGAARVAGIRLASVLAAVAQRRRAPPRRRPRRARPARPRAADARRLGLRVDGLDRRVEVGGQRRAARSRSNSLTPTTTCSPGLDPRPARGMRGDQRLLHVAGLDRRDRAAHRLDPVDLGCARPRPARRPSPRPRATRRRCRRTRAGRTRRRAPAACAATTAGPTAAAARAPRSRRAAGRRGPGRSCDSVTPSISSTIRWTLFSGCASVRPSELTCTPYRNRRCFGSSTP